MAFFSKVCRSLRSQKLPFFLSDIDAPCEFAPLSSLPRFLFVPGDVGLDEASEYRHSEVLQGRLAFEPQQVRWYSRPRGPLWRGRKGIGKEALQVLGELKRYKNDSLRLGNVMQSKVARLLKIDLIAVLTELQRQSEVDLALKVFNMARKEVWYKPDAFLYKDMLSCLALNQRVKDCETLLKDLKKEGIKPDGLLLTEVMTAYLECQMVPQAMEVFDEMRQGSVPPDRPAFKVLLRYLKKLGKRELRMKTRKEYLAFYEGVEEDDEEYNNKLRKEDEMDETACVQKLRYKETPAFIQPVFDIGKKVDSPYARITANITGLENLVH